MFLVVIALSAVTLLSVAWIKRLYYFHPYLRGVAPLDLAMLSAATYKDVFDGQKLPPGWAHDSRPHLDSEPGHHSCCIDIFVHAERECVVIAVRGTCPGFIGDLISDLKLLLQKLACSGDALPAYCLYVRRQMDAISKRFPWHEKYLTGHSLGACVAEAAWLSSFEESGWSTSFTRGDWRCVTFESPGFMIPEQLSKKVQENQRLINDRVLHFLGAPNPINTLHPHLSRRRYRVFINHRPTTVKHVAKQVVRTVLVVANWVSLYKLAVGFLGTAGQTLKAANGVAKGTGTWRRLYSTVSTASATAASSSPVAVAAHTSAATTSPLAAATANTWAAKTIKFIVSMCTGKKKDFSQHLSKLDCEWMAKIWAPFSPWNAVYIVGDVGHYVYSEHSIDNMVAAFDPNTGLPRVSARIRSWPSSGCNLKGNVIGNILRSMFLFPSLKEVTDANHAQEKKIEGLAGYEVDDPLHLTPQRIEEKLGLRHGWCRDRSPSVDYIALEHKLRHSEKSPAKGEFQLPHA